MSKESERRRYLVRHLKTWAANHPRGEKSVIIVPDSVTKGISAAKLVDEVERDTALGKGWGKRIERSYETAVRIGAKEKSKRRS